MPRPALTDEQKRLRGTFNKQFSEASRALKVQMRADLHAAYLGHTKPKPPPSRALPDLRDDPWFYLDIEHGDDRLRRLLARDTARKRSP